MSESSVYEGEFAKGGPGVTTMPIPLQGRGSIELRPDGFVVIGWQRHVSHLVILVVALGMIVAMFGVGVLASPDTLGARMGGRSVGTIIALVGGIVAVSVIASRSKLRRVTFDVPWHAVKKATRIQDREVVVTIHGIRPKGTLHFVPANRAEELEAQIAAGIGQARTSR
jgi:hypothetical protein